MENELIINEQQTHINSPRQNDWQLLLCAKTSGKQTALVERKHEKAGNANDTRKRVSIEERAVLGRKR